jgi:tetratricopeptide (TPR) repeat protein
MRACKIYQNINYRFNYGDVYGAMVDMEAAETKAAKEEPEIYGKLNDLKISTHSNLAAAKLKLNKFESVYDITTKIINEFDAGHIKALFMNGKSCIKLRKLEEAVEVLTKLNEINPNNEEFINELNNAKQELDADTKKKKNMFKKMIFSN